MQDLAEAIYVPVAGRKKAPPLSFRALEIVDAPINGQGGAMRALSACMSTIKYLCFIADKAEDKIKALEKRVTLLERLSTSDELTGLLNRRGFFDSFAKEMDRTNRGHSEGGLMIMVDLDNFKSINDTHGHQAGDAALRLVAKTLSADIRTMDSCARLGGDEFVLLLANTERGKALVRAQNMIKKLNSLSLVWFGKEIPVRASLGLKDYKAGDDADDIFGVADKNMYDDKRNNKRAPIDIPHAS
jgi:diguanylate cyclase (GGDEF)-like protein